MGDRSFQHGCFPIQIKYLTTALGRILSGDGIDFWCMRSLVRILSGPYVSAIHLFVCFFVTDFVHKTLSLLDKFSIMTVIAQHMNGSSKSDCNV